METSTLKSIGIFSISLFTAFSAAYIYSPVIGTHADTSSIADVNLKVNEVMALTLSTNTLNLNTAPNNFVSGIITATVSTNSQYGYTLSLEDEDDSSNMTHTNTNIGSTVTSDFSGSKTSSELETNTWGFSLNTTDFYKVPVNGSPVALKRTTTPMTTDSESTDITFGAKVGNITSGTYTDTVLFTMYVNGQDGKPTNPDDPTNPPTDPGEPGTGGNTDPNPGGDAENMQGYRCELDNIGDRKTVVDSRDGSRYRIERLADGNCWMLDNLRIAGKTLTSEDSNLPAGETYELPASDIHSFDGLPAYTSAVYVDSTYGGYYNYYTATAAWGGVEELVGGTHTTNAISPKDICPKGWHIPSGDPTGEVKALVDAYGSDGLTAQKLDLKFTGTLTNYNGEGTLMVTDIFGDDSGHFWTSKAMDSLSAHEYYILLHEGTTYYSWEYWSTKTFGYSVRCIAR